jgi:hypothetical protein
MVTVEAERGLGVVDRTWTALSDTGMAPSLVWIAVWSGYG